MESVNTPYEIHMNPAGMHKGHMAHPVGATWTSSGNEQEHHKADVCNSWATHSK